MNIFKYVLLIFACCISVISEGQVLTEKERKHWMNMPDCCIEVFDCKEYSGFLLDGKKLLTFQNYLPRSFKKYFILEGVDSNCFDVCIKISDVTSFEHSFTDTLAKNKDLVLNSEAYCPMYFYYRQYVKLRDTSGNEYLLVGFHTENNLERDSSGAYFYKGNTNEQKLELSERTELMSRRLWYSRHFHWNLPSCTQFFVVYDITNDKMRVVLTLDL